MKKFTLTPGCLFPAAAAVLYELLFHCWIGESMTAAQLIPIFLFGLGIGGAASLIAALIPWPKVSKWFSVVFAAVLAVLYMTEFCLNESFRTFMTPQLMVSGAGGVANGFMDVVLGLILNNWWRIVLVIAPIAAYILLVDCERPQKLFVSVLGNVTTGAWLLAFLTLILFNGDLSSMSSQYNFDAGVRSRGLGISVLQELTGLGTKQQSLSFTTVTVPTVEPPATESTEPTEPEATEGPTEPPREYKPHVLDLDFADLANTAGNLYLRELCGYVAATPPAMENDYTGLFAGKNLIFISAEAFTKEVIDPELTPTLYRLANEGICFTDYYQPAWQGGTSGGEISNLSGLVPETSSGMYGYASQKPFNTIGNLLKAQGYFSRAYHNNTFDFYGRNLTHEDLGYEKFIAYGTGMEAGVTPVWPQSDLEMIDFTVPQYIDHQPFSIYYMSVSGHSVYSQQENAMSRKNYEAVKDLDHSEPVKCYLAANLEFEYAMASLVRQLEEAGIADDTVIVISADHFPYGLDSSSAWGNATNYVSELFGLEGSYDQFTRDHNALIIWSGCLEGKHIQVDTPTYSLDILPTLSNLFGTEYDSRLLVGRDVFSDTMPLVLWPNHFWITEYGRYDATNRLFTPNPGVSVPEGYVEQVNAVVTGKINYSRGVQTNRLLAFLAKELESAE